MPNNENKNENVDMSPLREAAVQIHEIYEEFKSAGFSRKEAMQLTQNMVSTMFGQTLSSEE